jgi:hypothetical protein
MNTPDNVVREVHDVTIPPEPPVGSVALCADGMIRQRAYVDVSASATRTAWRSTNEPLFSWGTQWGPLVAAGRVTVLYRPDGADREQLISQPGARTAARELVDVLSHNPHVDLNRPELVDVLRAALALRDALDR